MALLRRVAPLLAGALLAPGPCRVGLLTAPEVPPNAQPVPFERITQVFYSGFEEPGRQVIRTQAAWSAFWARLQESITPRPPAPAIDFSRDLVIGAAMGSRGSGGYAIQIAQVAEDQGRLFVAVREVSPGERCGVTLALTQPVDVVRVPGRAGREVAFVERRETRDC
ncbi:MAG TPA: protease complex subunit PrcB family protein [Gemmatimonadales bacterium]|nr:protease complex subunit PrcB family protein [Gemmatimonadales bacterium]